MEHAFASLSAPVLRVGSADVPMPYNKKLEQAALPDVDRVVARVREVMEF
jgi:pyruvate/2-oxoglutarate/acetoin dehydrogenase E1 component